MKPLRLQSCILALAGLALAGASVGSSLRARRAPEPLRVDGRLDEDAWAGAPVAAGFTQQWPDFGRPCPQPTEVRVVYDAKGLCIGARMRHAPGGRVVRRLHRRDQDSSSDWFGVYVDSLLDRRSAVAFYVNAAGVQRDAVYYADTTQDASWDGVWESAVRVDAEGWTAELRIPYSLLRMRVGDGPQAWGVNFSRTDQGGPRHTSYWALAPRGVNGFVSQFPVLTGLEALPARPRRELVPYVSAQRKFETTRAYDDRGWTWRGGLDAHLGLRESGQVDLTVFPDFGQVEVDQAVVNLGTFESYFPEKRPFFLEGMDFFEMPGPQLLYTRRIGRGLSDPDLDAAKGERILDRPDAADISAAAKYTERFEGGFSLGLMGARVEPARARLADEAGARHDRELAPLTHYGVLRARQALDDHGSYVGGFASVVDASGRANREAQVQALDAVLRSRDRSGLLEFVSTRSLAGLPGAQEEGWRNRLRLNQRWGEGYAAELQAIQATRRFDPNDLGYLSRADEERLYGSLSRRWDASWGSFRNLDLGFSATAARDTAGRVFERSASASAQIETTSFLSFWLNGGFSFAADDDRELRTYDDPVKKYLRTPDIPSFGLGMDTAGNRPWYVRLTADRSWHPGGPSTGTRLYQSIKLGPAVELQVDSTYDRQEGEQAYLGVDDQQLPVVGLRRLSQFNQILRLACAFSPRFTVQVFSQWLASNRAFREPQVYVDDRSLAPVDYAGERAFSTRTWALNLITRWEYRPGSTFFLVYTHGAETDALVNDRASLSPRRDLALMNRLPSDDGVQVKLSYLFR